MVEAKAGATAGSGKRQEIVQYEGRMQYNCSDRPLDFSFMYIKTVGRKSSITFPQASLFLI